MASSLSSLVSSDSQRNRIVFPRIQEPLPPTSISQRRGVPFELGDMTIPAFKGKRKSPPPSTTMVPGSPISSCPTSEAPSLSDLSNASSDGSYFCYGRPLGTPAPGPRGPKSPKQVVRLEVKTPPPVERRVETVVEDVNDTGLVVVAYGRGRQVKFSKDLPRASTHRPRRLLPQCEQTWNDGMLTCHGRGCKHSFKTVRELVKHSRFPAIGKGQKLKKIRSRFVCHMCKKRFEMQAELCVHACAKSTRCTKKYKFFV